MRVRSLHGWDVTAEEAIALQRRLRGRILLAPGPALAEVRVVAGVDLSGADRETGRVRGAIMALSFPDLALIEAATAEDEPRFPYVPGLLSFRELPVLTQALERLSATPDVLLVDGQGIAHPRRMGIATHLGLLADAPTIGCAKSRLFGQHGPVGPERGDWTPLTDRGEVIGAVVRTRAGASPLYVSPGHRMDVESAVRLTLACTPRYRLPEPTRQAHMAAGGRPMAVGLPTGRRAPRGRGDRVK